MLAQNGYITLAPDFLDFGESSQLSKDTVIFLITIYKCGKINLHNYDC